MKTAPIHRDKRFLFAGIVIGGLLLLTWKGIDIPDGILDLIQTVSVSVLGLSKLGDWFRHKWPTEKAPDK
jgi:hypothetical protein